MARKIELEADLEARCVARIEALGGLALKLVIPGVRGFPDRTVLMNPGAPSVRLRPGEWGEPARVTKTWFFETKRLRTGKVSAQQTRWADRLRSLGFHVYFIDNDAQFEAALAKEIGHAV